MRTLFIIGTSRGFGALLAAEALAGGDAVVATARIQNEDGSRVAYRWRVTGKNNGILGTHPGHEPILMLGTAIFAVREDGLLQHNWVERNAWELHRRLINVD